jgi:hypothetical protein
MSDEESKKAREIRHKATAKEKKRTKKKNRQNYYNGDQ